MASSSRCRVLYSLTLLMLLLVTFQTIMVHYLRSDTLILLVWVVRTCVESLIGYVLGLSTLYLSKALFLTNPLGLLHSL
ncbi:hypothetical protein PRUPE_8G088100 [Prunus persica]|uniref:Uncharacterized protein n=1 Tax=Prunus persica TaxID=3760 RepID=A0A251MXG7_PRUPE|nr:hypothetical protein PRUPE_8G088100 [Prunus persica]